MRHARLEKVCTLLLFRPRTEKRLASFLLCPVINNEGAIDEEFGASGGDEAELEERILLARF